MRRREFMKMAAVVPIGTAAVLQAGTVVESNIQNENCDRKELMEILFNSPHLVHYIRVETEKNWRWDWINIIKDADGEMPKKADGDEDFEKGIKSTPASAFDYFLDGKEIYLFQLSEMMISPDFGEEVKGAICFKNDQRRFIYSLDEETKLYNCAWMCDRPMEGITDYVWKIGMVKVVERKGDRK